MSIPRRSSRSTTNPPPTLSATAPTSRAVDNGTPICDALSAKISGSMDGDAIQNAITADSGTPLTSNRRISGITMNEQKGLNAPTAAAATTPTQPLLSRRRARFATMSRYSRSTMPVMNTARANHTEMWSR